MVDHNPIQIVPIKALIATFICAPPLLANS